MKVWRRLALATVLGLAGAAIAGHVSMDFARQSDPATVPGGTVNGVMWNDAGTILAVGHVTNPNLMLYQQSGATFTKLPDPASLPAGQGRGGDFTDNGAFFAIAAASTPNLLIYTVSGTTFTKLPDPTLPGGSAYDAEFSPGIGEFLAVAHGTSPFVTIYQRSGETFAKLPDPASLPTGQARGVSWSPDGAFLCVAHFTSPRVTIYQRSGTTFTKLSNPATLPTGDAEECEWTPDGGFLAVAHATSPRVTVYAQSGTTFTKLSNPSTLPAGDGEGVAWSADSTFLTVSHSASPFISVYELDESGSTLTKLGNPAVLPPGSSFCTDSDWSNVGSWVAVGCDGAPYLAIYFTGMGGPPTGTIVIVKDAVPNHAQDFAFITTMLAPCGTFSLDDDSDGTLANSISCEVSPGTYSVTEFVPAGWAQTSATCSDGSPVTAITLSSSETVTCTFVNTRTQGTVVIVKNAVPDHAQDFNFTSTLPGCETFQLDDDADGTLSSSITCDVPVGTYSVSEDPVRPRTASNRWRLTTPVVCTDGSPVASIAVSAGETLTCTFLNTKIEPVEWEDIIIPPDLPGAIGVSETAAEVLLGAFITFLFTVGGFVVTVPFGMAPMGAAAGALGGFGVSLAFGFFPLWILLLVLAAAAAIGVLVMSRRGG